VATNFRREELAPVIDWKKLKPLIIAGILCLILILCVLILKVFVNLRIARDKHDELKSKIVETCRNTFPEKWAMFSQGDTRRIESIIKGEIRKKKNTHKIYEPFIKNKVSVLELLLTYSQSFPENLKDKIEINKIDFSGNYFKVKGKIKGTSEANIADLFSRKLEDSPYFSKATAKTTANRSGEFVSFDISAVINRKAVR
jgi:hypothetical protein